MFQWNGIYIQRDICIIPKIQWSFFLFVPKNYRPSSQELVAVILATADFSWQSWQQRRDFWWADEVVLVGARSNELGFRIRPINTQSIVKERSCASLLWAPTQRQDWNSAHFAFSLAGSCMIRSILDDDWLSKTRIHPNEGQICKLLLDPGGKLIWWKLKSPKLSPLIVYQRLLCCLGGDYRNNCYSRVAI